MAVNIIALSGAIFIGIPGLLMLKNPQQATHKTAALPTGPIHTAAPKRIS